ncbi:MAG TPA: ABC transporter ATP-binding protein [Anaerolineae bacterium]|jgi:ABC-2 type transport system ATP-binding protein
MENAIVASDLSKRFGHFTAIDHITFSVPRGQIFGFLGPNGSGKTTTIRILLGLMKPCSGKAEVLGMDITRHPERVRAQLGYMSQRFSLYNDLTVIENLRFFGRAYGLHGARLRSQIDFALQMADLVGRERQYARLLAGGWRQRLALGAAIMHTPQLVYLDEPTAGVDPVSRRMFWDLLYQLTAQGMTVFVTTHYMDEAEHCNQLAFIHNGHIIAEGTPGDIKTRMMHGEVLELALSDPARAVSLLRAAQADGRIKADEVALYGLMVHVIGADMSGQQALIKSLLRAEGIEPGADMLIPPSLEDVFIANVR